jgi:hypothetical protein
MRSPTNLSCPDEVPGIHEFLSKHHNVDGWDKPGHDEFLVLSQPNLF